MDEVLTEADVNDIDALHNFPPPQGCDCVRRLKDSHEELRIRLESAEAARRDAQESRFALIIQNEELGAELADLRARLESAEAVCHAARRLLLWDPEEYPQCQAELRRRLQTALDAWGPAVLGAAGERSEG